MFLGATRHALVYGELPDTSWSMGIFRKMDAATNKEFVPKEKHPHRTDVANSTAADGSSKAWLSRLVGGCLPGKHVGDQKR